VRYDVADAPFVTRRRQRLADPVCNDAAHDPSRDGRGQRLTECAADGVPNEASLGFLWQRLADRVPDNVTDGPSPSRTKLLWGALHGLPLIRPNELR
jgi:hypothetical protein